MHSLVAVQAMLMGMALECLLKGMWIKNHQAWSPLNRHHALTKDGKLVRKPGAGDHNLEQLAKIAEVVVSQNEKIILQRLSRFILFAGRYPIPTTWEQTRPVRSVIGERVSPRFFAGTEMEIARNLVERLMQEVVPWSSAT